MRATYNGYGQLIAEKWYSAAADTEPAAHYRYVYDNSGNIVRSIDIKEEKEYNYTYEEGRIVRAAEYGITLDESLNVTAKTLVSSIDYAYNSKGLLSKKTVAVGSTQAVYYTEYPENASPVVKVTVNGRTVTSHSKTDGFGRKIFDELQLGSGFVSRQFSYHAGSVTEEHKENAKLKSSPTTNLVSQITYSGGRTLGYAYDAEERITGVVDAYVANDVSVSALTTYTYDALGQLLTETVNGEVVNTMTYDAYGNILTKNGLNYVYDNVWKDLLTSYNGQSITYDAQGNPTNYLGHNLTWEKGRQLKSFDNIQYTYNANGIRTSKTVNGIKHSFALDGSKILREEWCGNALIPLYDNADSVCGIMYNGQHYFFLKNLQGDVIAITDSNGDTVARYSYDAWGKCTVEFDGTGYIAGINPFRYRGYYYDQETGFYYLQSRYYDPSVGRFINGDDIDFIGISEKVTDINLFAYCNNNPINNIDMTGYFSLESLLSIIKNIFNSIINKIQDYIHNLWGKDENNNIFVSTIVISTVIDAIIASIVRAIIYSNVKRIMKKVLSNGTVRNKFVTAILDFLVSDKLGRMILKLFVNIGATKAGKPNWIGVVKDNLLQDFFTNIITSKSEILRKSSSLISAFSSIGGIIAFFLDRCDGSWDEKFTIKTSYEKVNNYNECCAF